MSRAKPIPIPQSVLLKEEDLSFYLVFKIITEEKISLSKLRRKLPILWKCKSTCIISEYHGDHDIFLAKFEDKSEVGRIVEGAPWVLQDNLVSVQKCEPYKPPRAYPFFISPFYARVYNLPKYLSSSTTLLNLLNRKLGDAVSPLEEIRDGSDKSVRVRVNIDVSKPLVGSLSLYGTPVHVSYENLPKYCIFCGLIGHEARNDRCEYFEVTESKYKHSLRYLQSEANLHSGWKQGPIQSLAKVAVATPNISEFPCKFM